MVLKDGNNEKYEVLRTTNTIITVRSKEGLTFNIPAVYLTDYKEKKCKKS